MISAAAKQVVNSVLQTTGIVRIISVDDNYEVLPRLDDVLGACSVLDSAELERLLAGFPGLFSADAEVLEKRIRNLWNESNDEAKRHFCALFNVIGDSDAAQENAEVAAITELPILFEGYNFRTLGLPEWKTQADKILEESRNEPTLVMFDENFSKHGGAPDEGLTLIKEALDKAGQGQLTCCLFSRKYHLNTLLDSWRRLCEEHGLPLSRFVLIPKETLIDHSVEFAALLKLSAVSRHYDDPRKGALEFFAECVDIADNKISLLNIYDLDRIVFVFSTREGVWEPDTLFRLLAIYHRAEIRRRALKDERLRGASTLIRRVSGIDVPSGLTLAPDGLRGVHHLENYEESDALNGLHRPTDLGDIYEKSGGRQYILIAPQCDLMVRTRAGYRGNDSDLLRDGVLAELVTEQPKFGWKVEFYTEEADIWVDFKRTFSARLIHLDLCVFNAEGKAEFCIDSPPAELLIPAWQKRHKVVVREVERLLQIYLRVAPTGAQKNDVNRLVTRSDNDCTFFGTLDSNSRTLRLNFRRVARLLVPGSTALVKAYSQFLNRDAFEHRFLEQKNSS